MLKRQDNKIVDWFVTITVFYPLRGESYSTGARAASCPSDEQEGIRLIELPGGPDGINNLVHIFLGYFRPELVYLAHAMTTRLPPPDEYSVLVISLDSLQSAQIGGIRVDGEDTGGYLNPPLTASPPIQPGKLIGNTAATLS